MEITTDVLVSRILAARTPSEDGGIWLTLDAWMEVLRVPERLRGSFFPWDWGRGGHTNYRAATTRLREAVFAEFRGGSDLEDSSLYPPDCREMVETYAAVRDFESEIVEPQLVACVQVGGWPLVEECLQDAAGTMIRRRLEND